MALTQDQGGAEFSVPPASEIHLLLERIDDAEAALARGDDAGAENLALSVLTGAPQDLGAVAVVAAVALNRQRPDLALTRLSAITRHLAGDFRLSVLLGRAALAVGQLDRAAAAFTDAQVLDIRDPAPWRGICAVRLAQGQLHLAMQAGQEAAARAPDDPDVWAELGTVQLAAQQPDAAADAMGKALALDPDNPIRLYDLALTARAQGRFDDAAALFEEAAEGLPDRPEPLNMLAASLVDAGDLHAAVDVLTQAIERFPTSRKLRENLDVLASRAARRAPAKAYGAATPAGGGQVKLEG